MTPRDEQRLVGVHPQLVAALRVVFDQLDAEDAPLFVVEGLRTDARQAELYAQGRTTPGPVVTYKDGVTHKSNHQPKANGLGRAVDCAFIATPQRQPFDPRWPWLLYGEALEAQGIAWGGRWKSPVDMPHAELIGDVDK